MGPQALRMNLNTLLRHEVFGQNGTDSEMVDYVAARIADADEIRQSRQFPYQYLAAYLNAGGEVPQKIKAALHQAAEIACGNVPELPGPVVIGLDVSGSMAVAGHGPPWPRGNQRRCAASMWRPCSRRPSCAATRTAWSFRSTRRRTTSRSIRTTRSSAWRSGWPSTAAAERTARCRCARPTRGCGERRFAGCVLVSDNESWVYRAGARLRLARLDGRDDRVAAVRAEPAAAAARHRKPKLVCIDLQPYTTTQAPERDDILNVGGFSDAVFSVVASFLADDAEPLRRRGRGDRAVVESPQRPEAGSNPSLRFFLRGSSKTPTQATPVRVSQSNASVATPTRKRRLSTVATSGIEYPQRSRANPTANRAGAAITRPALKQNPAPVPRNRVG